MANEINENKVQFGFSDVHYAKSQYNAATKKYTYGPWKSLPGGVSVNLPAQLVEIIKYADNIAYFKKSKNNGYQGDLANVLFTDEFRHDILNDVIDEESGDVLENADALSEEFALGFTINGDPYDKRRILYRCSIGRPALAASTTAENIEISDETATLNVMPRENDHFITRSAKKGSLNYDKWFTEVVEPPTGEENSNETTENETDETTGGEG